MMQSHYASQTKLIIYNVSYFSAKEQEIIFSNNKNVNTSVSLSTLSHHEPVGFMALTLTGARGLSGERHGCPIKLGTFTNQHPLKFPAVLKMPLCIGLVYICIEFTFVFQLE